MAAENKKFTVKDDDTSYTLSQKGVGKFLVWWYDEDKKYHGVDYLEQTVEKHFSSGNWKFVEEQKESSIARPILEERKLGKVKMELFDEGFPNAVMEVAKVMGWAAENKGYKPHDWVNLPDAESSFPAAASRHRVKGLIQKVSGVAVSDRVDEESAILHKAHEAFNVLAELELMVRGKIK